LGSAGVKLGRMKTCNPNKESPLKPEVYNFIKKRKAVKNDLSDNWVIRKGPQPPTEYIVVLITSLQM